MVLSDGSRVELNTNSKIIVATATALRGGAGARRGDVRGRQKRPPLCRQDQARAAWRPMQLGDGRSAHGRRAAVTVEVRRGAGAQRGAPSPRRSPNFRRARWRWWSARGTSVHPVSAAEIDRTLVWRNGAIALSGETLGQGDARSSTATTPRRSSSTDPATASLRVGGYFQTSDVRGLRPRRDQTFPGEGHAFRRWDQCGLSGWLTIILSWAGGSPRAARQALVECQSGRRLGGVSLAHQRAPSAACYSVLGWPVAASAAPRGGRRRAGNSLCNFNIPAQEAGPDACRAFGRQSGKGRSLFPYEGGGGRSCTPAVDRVDDRRRRGGTPGRRVGA